MFGDILTEAPELAHNFMSYFYLYRKLFEVAGAGLQFYVLLVPVSLII